MSKNKQPFIPQGGLRALHCLRDQRGAMVPFQRPDSPSHARGCRRLLQALHLVLHPTRTGAAQRLVTTHTLLTPTHQQQPCYEAFSFITTSTKITRCNSRSFSERITQSVIQYGCVGRPYSAEYKHGSIAARTRKRDLMMSPTHAWHVIHAAHGGIVSRSQRVVGGTISVRRMCCSGKTPVARQMDPHCNGTAP